MKNLPYEGIVEGYFKVDVLSKELREKFERYKVLVSKEELSDSEVEHLRPHHNRTILDRVFDWNNLFYACPHCNNLKK